MQQPGSITFGTPLTPASTGTFGGFGTGSTFGSTNTGLKFGANPTSTTTSNLFGSTTGGLSFGAPTTTTTTTGGFSFGTNQPTGLTFGTTTTAPTTVSGFSFGTTSIPNIGLNKPASTTQPLTFGLSGTSTATAPSLTSGTTGTSLFTSNLGGVSGFYDVKPITTTTTITGLTPNVSQQPLQPIPNIGLGGVDTFQNKSGVSGGTATKESDCKLTKEQPLPNEFIQLIDGFKNHIKQQKMYSSDVARGTMKPLRKIQEDIDQLKSMLVELGNSIGISNRQQAEKLKFETAKCLSHAEMAQRIHDTPPGFQIDNTAPLQYFIETVHKFENDLSAIRQQIEATEKHIKSMERPKTLSSQEMTLGLRRLHETFVSLAGRLQSLHSQVEMQKTQYLNMRKYLFKDTMNVLVDQQNNFSNNSLKQLLNQSNRVTPPKRAAGPTPFSTLGKSTLSFISSSQQQSSSNGGAGSGSATSGPPNQTTTQPPPAYPGSCIGNQPQFTWGVMKLGGGIVKPGLPPPSYNASVGLRSNSQLLFGGGGGVTSTTSTNDFQLQKPPTGNKRGKH